MVHGRRCSVWTGELGSMHEVHKAKSLRLERERLGLLNTDMHIQIRVRILRVCIYIKP
jgi:hypothetical protein